MLDIFEVIRKVSVTTSSVLIIGESGTGKELIARSIHHLSRRPQAPFVPVDCGAIPESLIESELFGHEKGAFTGAHYRKTGKFEQAHRGTLFLDEISNLPYDLQSKLLRVLQERVVTPVGGHRVLSVDVRIVAACNVNLSEAVSDGRFRQDLYFRLKVIPIRLPPLRERTEDIPLLAEHFIAKFNRQHQKGIKGLSEQALSVMEAYDWPGNIREISNLVESLVILGKDGSLITLRDLPIEILLGPERRTQNENILERGLKEMCRSFERQVILQTLDALDWNRSKAAKALKIHRNTLTQKLQEGEKTTESS
jgi:two-component system response regulator HydG/two-component system nitrogen regulation response regulator NtrX